MILTFHIILSLVSITYSIFIAIKPSKYNLKNIYILTSGTLLSGIVLATENTQNLGQFCLSGTIYLGVTITLNKISKYRFSLLNNN